MLLFFLAAFSLMQSIRMRQKGITVGPETADKHVYKDRHLRFHYGT